MALQNLACGIVRGKHVFNAQGRQRVSCGLPKVANMLKKDSGPQFVRNRLVRTGDLALWQHGYWGILALHFRSFGGGQVFAELVIALSLVMVWLWSDARKQGRTAWPWLLATLVLGSFGPLAYLLTRRSKS